MNEASTNIFLLMVFGTLLLIAIGLSIRVWWIRRKYRHLL